MPTTDDASIAKRVCLVCHGEFPADQKRCPKDGTILVVLSSDPHTGKVLADRYEVEALIGTGGTSMVYRAQHNQLRRPVAIKMLKSNLVTDEESKKRFEQEARAVSCLTHPHVVTVYDVGVTAYGEPYIVMEYLQGTSLAELIRSSGPLEPQRALQLFIDAAGALAHAHRKTVIHRDVKTSNIMLVPAEDGPESVKIVDFGLAKLRTLTGEYQRVTKTGDIFGSPIYMSPEQCTGRKVDLRTDIYSFGVVMYETLTGSPPFRERSSIDTIRRHIKESPPPFAEVNQQVEISPRLQHIVFRCLNKNPDDRYQTMDELKAELEAAVDLLPAALSAAAVDYQRNVTSSARLKAVPAGDSSTPASGTFSKGMVRQPIGWVILVLLLILVALLLFLHPFAR